MLCKSRSIRSILEAICFHILPLWSKETFKHVCLNISFHKFIVTSQNFDILWKLEFRLHFLCCPFCSTVHLRWRKSCENVLPFVHILDTKAANNEFDFRETVEESTYSSLIMLWGTKQCSSSAEVFISTPMSEARGSNAQNWCIRNWLWIPCCGAMQSQESRMLPEWLFKNVFWYLRSN